MCLDVLLYRGGCFLMMIGAVMGPTMTKEEEVAFTNKINECYFPCVMTNLLKVSYILSSFKYNRPPRRIPELGYRNIAGRLSMNKRVLLP